MSPQSENLQRLDQLDLESISIADIRKLSNQVLRNVLLEAVAVTAATAVAKDHTSHGMHTPGHGMFTSHAKSELLERVFGRTVRTAPIVEGPQTAPSEG